MTSYVGAQVLNNFQIFIIELMLFYVTWIFHVPLIIHKHLFFCIILLQNSFCYLQLHGTSQAASMSAGDLTEQLAQNKQLITQLKELVKEKENELHNKEQQLKDEKEASEAKISKLKLQNKAKVTSLASQLEELKKQLSGAGSKEGKSEQKKGSRDGDQDNAAASRGKILVLKKKIEELETQNAQRNEELQRKTAEVDAAHQRGAEIDAMLAEKQKKLDEKEAYIIDLQLSCGSNNDAKELLILNNELKNHLSTKEASLQSMQILVQNLTKKVGDSEERCSLLEEQIKNLKSLQSKEKAHFQEREAMYTQNIRMFQNIIQEKEKELMGLAQKHEQELFKMAAKSDASADLEQLLKALKQKLHEKEEVMLGRTQVIVMLQQELDAKDQQLKEINEHLNRLQLEKDNLQSKLNAEKHVMRAQLRDMMEKHENEMKEVKKSHNVEIQVLLEKHETELQEKDQIQLQLQKQLDKLSSGGQNDLEQAVDIDAVIKLKLEQLEAQAKLKMEEASKSEARFLKMKAWSKSTIRQLEDELKNLTSASVNVTALHDRISELEQEKEDLQSTLQSFTELKTQNEELLAKLEVYEEQQRKLQADLEQVTKRAASQPSESGSVDELQSRLLEWQEIVTESEDVHNQIREEKSAMALRMAQIEEEREAIVSGQQELEEELATGQGIDRMQPERRKMAQSSRKLQEDYGFDGKQCFEELNVTLDSTDSAEGENMGGWWPEYTSSNTGLRTVVEELELERNQLQEQILFLEERCRDFEDRLQLQSRMEALQNENDRLQSQLTQLRNQHVRDAEKHQVLVSSFNEQLKGLNERNGLLESLLGEKDQKISSTTEKLEQIEYMRSSLQERDLLNKELSEKLLQTEQKLEDALKKCSAYGVECAEQKALISDLTEKVAAFKEKTVKQDAAVELIRLELEQTNEELDRLNTSHLEERSQLIQDLQRREREIDNLKEVVTEKDKEITALSSSMTEYTEQINILKCQIKCKEDDIREMEGALARVEREAQLLKDVQTADVKDASNKISELSQQLSTMESKLAKEKLENESRTKENEDLFSQIKEFSKTVKELNLEIKTHDVIYTNKLMECESQIKLLKEQISKSTEKLHETERKYKEEIEHLKSQLDEHVSAKEKLNNLLKERENKEQSFINELKSVKDLYNQLTLENAKKDEELAKLSRQLAEHTEHLEMATKSLQEKNNIIISLKDKLKTAEQQSEKEKIKLVEELDNKEMKLTEINNKLQETCEIITKLETERQASILTNSQWQAALEQKEKEFAGQLKTMEDLSSEVKTMESEKQQLISENESLSKLLDIKECELLKRAQTMTEMESKMSATATEHQRILSEVSHDKETFKNKVEELSNLVKQKENSVAEQLIEKQKECGLLADQLSKSRELTEQLCEEIKMFSIQLQDVKDRMMEKEGLLSQKESECSKMGLQLSQEEEKVSSLQKQVQDIKIELEVKSKSLDEKSRLNDGLLRQIEEKQVNVVELEREIERLQGDGIQLSHQLEEKDSVVSSQRLDLEELQKQIAKKMEECTALSDQIVLLVKEVDILKCEKDSALAICSAKSSECDAFQHQLTQHHSEIVFTKHEAHMLKLENEKMKADIETINATFLKKCEGVIPLNVQLSQQGYSVFAFTEQIDTLVSEIKTLKCNFHAKETLLFQKEAVIEQMKEKIDAGEKTYLKMVSDLQSQVQVLHCDIDELRKEVQEKENELKKQTQELKLLKNKSEESDLLRVQLSENMEIISNLQSQIENMTKKTEELSQSVTQKDNFLRQKEEECVNLQACISESSSVQQKHVQSLISEAEQLRAVISEKESMVNNTLLLDNKLKAELQEKETECEMSRKQVKDLEESNFNLKKEINDQKNIINNINRTLAEKEASLLSNVCLVEKLREDLNRNEEKLQLISQLHGQINEMTQEIQKSKELAQENVDRFSVENEQLVKNQNQLQQNVEKLKELNEKLESSENESRMHLSAITLQLENEREQLQMQVSVKCKEVDELKLKVEKLEHGLLASERRCVTELGRATQQNEISLKQLNDAERELKSKDAQIQSLQQEQDMIKKDLTSYLSVLSHSECFLKDSDSDAYQQVIESKTILEQLSALIDKILNQEAEAEALQRVVLEREKEMYHLNMQLESMLSLREEKEQIQNQLERVRDTNQSEMKYLSNELSIAKEALYKQQSLCEEKGIELTDMKKKVSVLQEKSDELEKELENNCKILNTQCQKEAKLAEEVQYKSQVIKNLISQSSQQKDLISTLSQQLKEKDCAVTQVMESLTNEMVKFSDEKNVLTIKLQQLEASQTSIAEEQIQKYKKECELCQVILTKKEETIKDLLDEKTQISVSLEKLSQEKDNLKKKLQASLIVRKDLMQKIENLEKTHQEFTEREDKKAQGVLEQMDEITKQVKSAEALNKNLESQLEGLKEQLLEKDAKIYDMSELLTTKTEYLEELQNNFTELKVALAEQNIMSDKNLIGLQEKDSLLQQKQSELTERERMYGEEHSQLFLTIEHLKANIAKKEEVCEQMNETEDTLHAGGSCRDSTHSLSEIHQLQKEKEILQKKLQALLMARKESSKKNQKIKEEHDTLLARINEITKDFEIIQAEYKALQAVNQKKCEELLLCSLQKTLASSDSVNSEKDVLKKTEDTHLEEIKI
uniref:Golgin subfamily B member 1-like n=1 Tax=Anolis carolinensis TaxID=28377 RepID=A0A803SNJ3_ANOCA